jgi:hypothetical protein
MFHPSFKEIFKSSLEDACASYKYSLNKETEKYLIKLCVDDLLVTSSRKPDGILDSLIFLDEVPSTKESLAYLKLNGDYHLSIAGYVPEAFCNKYIDFNYYISIGRYSYYRLHQKLPKEVAYKTLAYDYLDIVYILNETFDIIKVSSDEHLVNTWEAWRDTGHPIFRKRLIRLGLNPDLISS